MTLGFTALCGSVSAQSMLTLINGATLNGGFESPTLTASSKQGFDAPGQDITNWANTGTTFAGAAGATYNDNGVDLNTGGANTGNQFAFFHGGEGGAFNLTTYQLKVGDQISLSWFGRADTIAFRLFSSTNGTYATAATLAEIQQTQAADVYTAYALPTYTVTAADLVGGPKTLGVSIFNPTVGYANVDDVTLSVVSVPEPSTVLAFATGGVVFLGLGARRLKLAA